MKQNKSTCLWHGNQYTKSFTFCLSLQNVSITKTTKGKKAPTFPHHFSFGKTKPTGLFLKEHAKPYLLASPWEEEKHYLHLISKADWK